MLIDCPACARSYHVDRVEIEGGRTVICPRCDARWRVEVDGDVRPAAPALPNLDSASLAAWVTPAARIMPPPRRRARPRLPRGVAACVAGLALLSVTIEARAQVVRLVPRAAALYAAVGMKVNLRGLEFRDIGPRRVDPSSPEVTISGEIRNVSERRVRVPRLAFEIRDAAGMSLVTWTEKAPAKLVGAGRTLAFASAPHAIPQESRTVLVRFE